MEGLAVDDYRQLFGNLVAVGEVIVLRADVALERTQFYIARRLQGAAIGDPMPGGNQHAEVGTKVQIEYFGERLDATVSREPLYDPEMVKLKS